MVALGLGEARVVDEEVVLALPDGPTRQQRLQATFRADHTEGDALIATGRTPDDGLWDSSLLDFGLLQAAARPKSELARMRPNVLERDPALEASRAANNHEDIDALRELSAPAPAVGDALLPKYMRPDPDKARMTALPFDSW